MSPPLARLTIPLVLNSRWRFEMDGDRFNLVEQLRVKTRHKTHLYMLLLCFKSVQFFFNFGFLKIINSFLIFLYIDLFQKK